jgi:hypothetical protein
MPKLIRPAISSESPILGGFSPGYIAVEKGRVIGWFREVDFPFGLGTYFVGILYDNPVSVKSYAELCDIVEKAG